MASNPLPLAPSLSDPVGDKLAHTRALLTSIYRENKPEQVALLEPDSSCSDVIDPSLINQAIHYLAREQEDELKSLLKESFGCPDEEELLDNHVLNLMHKHRDDIAGVPFLFLTPSKRPISRPSSRASSHSVRLNRPETPTSAPPYPQGLGFRRPHTPISSPMNPLKEGSSYLDRAPGSPRITPASLLSNSTTVPSPLSSPRLLNATAAEFRPIPRPLSAAGSQSSLLNLRADTPSPDLWPHKSSNLAIAAPLLPDTSLLPPRSSSSLGKHSFPHEDENDEFDPFAIKPPPLFRPLPVSSDDGSNPSHDSATNDSGSYDNDAEADEMTPFDVLTSIFGSSFSQPELEEALESNGYDFESAMAWIVDKSSPLGGPQIHQNISHAPDPLGNSDKLRIAQRDSFFRDGFRGGFAPRGFMRGNMRGGPAGRMSGNKVCRYYLAGECMRADCRFSHDLDRALCRFWLRGICAKGEFCEFLHQLPKEQDINSLNSSMDNFNIGEEAPQEHEPEFPALGDRVDPQRRPMHDPGRTRFASAVKKPGTFNRADPFQSSGPENFHPSSIPKQSPRIKLRPPGLLPTLPTGDVLNAMYMNYRTRALQLGAARNACLSRAAEAWRRGDGAGAKRFSRDGQDLNSQMKAEARIAAGKLVRERARVAMDAVRNRDASWSDDSADRVSRGRVCGGGLGVCLGVASKKGGAHMERLTAEERTEVMLDLHGLHSNEATEVLEEYLLALEKEHFLGLAFLVVGEQKHTGMQDPSRGVSKARLAAGVREWLHRWGYPWMERDGIMAVDPITHA